MIFLDAGSMLVFGILVMLGLISVEIETSCSFSCAYLL